MFSHKNVSFGVLVITYCVWLQNNHVHKQHHIVLQSKNLRRLDAVEGALRRNWWRWPYTWDFDSARNSSRSKVIIPRGRIPARIPGRKCYSDYNIIVTKLGMEHINYQQSYDSDGKLGLFLSCSSALLLLQHLQKHCNSWSSDQKNVWQCYTCTYPSKSLGHSRSPFAFFGSGGLLMLLSDTVMVPDMWPYSGAMRTVVSTETLDSKFATKFCAREDAGSHVA